MVDAGRRKPIIERIKSGNNVKSAVGASVQAADLFLRSFCFSAYPLSSESPVKEDQKGLFLSFMSRFFPGTFAERHYGLKINKGTEESGINLSPSNLSNNRDISLGIPSYKFSYKDFERFYNWKGGGAKSDSPYYDDKLRGFMSLVSLDNKLRKDYGSGVSIKRKGLEYKVVIEIDVTNKSKEELEEVVRTISTDFLDIRDTKFIKTAADRLYRGVSLDFGDFSKNVVDNAEPDGLECLENKENAHSRAAGREFIESKNNHEKDNINDEVVRAGRVLQENTVIGDAESNGLECLENKENAHGRATGKEFIESKNNHEKDNINDEVICAGRVLQENTVIDEEVINNDKFSQRFLRENEESAANGVVIIDNDPGSRSR